MAPDSYKGSLTAKEACEAMEAGIRRVLPAAEIVQVPLADGGEGTVQSLVDATGGEVFTARVQNPLGVPVLARYGVLGDKETAVIEMAEASGLYLIAAQDRNPLITSTYGTGELIRKALDKGCRKFILGIGGSATNDGGMGMARALGARFYDEKGEELLAGGGCLDRLSRIDTSGLDPRLPGCVFTVACDVDNPLCGPHGASAVFGPQKGATPEMVRLLDANLEHYAQVLQRELGFTGKDLPGAGAAGGLGAGMMAFLGASLRPGVEIVMEAVRLAEKLDGARLVFSGEGQCDFQTARGKVPYGVAKAARQRNIPCVVIAGAVKKGYENLYQYGITSVFSIVNAPLGLEEAMARAAELLEETTERIMRLIAALVADEKI